MTNLNFCFAYSNQSTLSPTDREQFRGDMRDILTDQRFNYPDYLSGLKKFWEKVVDFWFKLKPVRKFELNDTWFEYAKKILFFIAIFLPIPLIYFLSKIWYREKKLSTSIPHQENVGYLPEQYIKLAEDLLQSGELREAIRHLYLAGLFFLKKDGFIPKGSGFSDSENLKHLQKRIGLENETYQAFSKLTRLFQEKWYGLKVCLTEDYYQAHSLLKTILGKHGETDAKI